MSHSPLRRTRSKIIRRAFAVALALAAVAGLAIGARSALDRSRNDQSVAIDEPETSVSTVDVRDLTVSYEATGTLQYDEPIGITTPVSGTVLRLVEPGAILSNGDIIAVVDEQPVVWLDGDVPAWRGLSAGDEGVDVLQLETALSALGFNADDDVTVDEDYTDATAAMVEDWQSSLGVDGTGRIDIETIVFGGARSRIASAPVAVGDSVENGATLITLGTERRHATLTAQPGDAVTLAVGDGATVELPDRTDIDGTIAAIEPGRDVWTLVVTFGTGVEFPTTDVINVDMTWASTKAAGALTVPSSALLRLDNGTYTVDVVNDDGTTARTPVVIGATVGTRTEITAGLAAGTDVITL